LGGIIVKKGKMLIASFLMILWYMSLLYSQVQFVSHTIFGPIIPAARVVSVCATDVDGDEDMDVLSASLNDNTIAWYENLGSVGIVDHDLSVVPLKFFLYQNYSNPFNPRTTIVFDLPTAIEVILKTYNILGEEVATLVSDRLSAGSFTYEWDARTFTSGVYLYSLKVGDYIETKKNDSHEVDITT
jgi:hypothetical protein